MKSPQAIQPPLQAKPPTSDLPLRAVLRRPFPCDRCATSEVYPSGDVPSRRRPRARIQSKKEAGRRTIRRHRQPPPASRPSRRQQPSQPAHRRYTPSVPRRPSSRFPSSSRSSSSTSRALSPGCSTRVLSSAIRSRACRSRAGAPTQTTMLQNANTATTAAARNKNNAVLYSMLSGSL